MRKLFLHPIKSLDAQEVTTAQVLASGALAHDRAFAIVDGGGVIVNAKKHAHIHELRSHLDLDSGRLNLRDRSDRGLGEVSFDIRGERRTLCEWLGAFFGFEVSLIEDRATGFPDDDAAPGPTVIGTQTLREIGRWFGLSLDEARARFRTNVEIDGVPPFWEDRLFGAPGTAVSFVIGGLRLEGLYPCQRCVVPSRQPWIGALDKRFAKTFSKARRETLPDWANRERFDHFYRLAVNTRIEGWRPGASIAVGDGVELTGLGEPVAAPA